MKTLTFIFVLLFVSGAKASYFATTCSNSSGSVRWESGQMRNEAEFQYYVSGETTVKKVPLHYLDLKFNDEQTIEENNVQNCNYVSAHKVWVAKMVITPTTEHPDSLAFLNTDNKVETTVICTYNMNSRAACPTSP